jgi:Mn-containing catalase
MSENPQVKAILEHIETRERELADHARQFRDRIEELTRQISENDAESENLRITHKTLLTLPLPSPATGPDRPDIPDHPAYQ